MRLASGLSQARSSVRDDLPEHREHRAQPPDRDAQLVDRLGIAAIQGGGLVRCPMAQAVAQDRLERHVDRGVAFQRERHRLVPGGRLAAGQSVTTGSLAAGLDVQRREPVQLKRQLEQRRGLALDQLELQLGERHRVAIRLIVPRSSAASTTRGRPSRWSSADVGPWRRTRVPNRAAARRRRADRPARRPLRPAPPPDPAPAQLSRACPLAPYQRDAARAIVGLDRLYEAPSVPPGQPEGVEAFAAQPQVVGVIETASSWLVRARPTPPAQHRACEYLLERGWIAGELELDLCVRRRIDTRAGVGASSVMVTTGSLRDSACASRSCGAPAGRRPSCHRTVINNRCGRTFKQPPAASPFVACPRSC